MNGLKNIDPDPANRHFIIFIFIVLTLLNWIILKTHTDKIKELQQKIEQHQLDIEELYLRHEK